MTNSNKAHQSTISRSNARKWTLCAQLASGVFVLGAVAVGVVGLPEINTSTTTNTTGMMPNMGTGMGMGEMPNNTKTTKTSQNLIQGDVDTIGLAMRLAMLDNAPELAIVDEPIETAVIDTPTTDDPTGSIIKRVRYIGFINDSQNKHAFIRIDGKQRVVTKGGVARAGNDSMPDLRVEQINARAIFLSDGKIRSRIPLADRNGASITVAGGPPVQVAAVVENGSLLTDEDEARIAAMPPRQQPLARRRLERERRGLSPDKQRPERSRVAPEADWSGSFNKKKND